MTERMEGLNSRPDRPGSSPVNAVCTLTDCVLLVRSVHSTVTDTVLSLVKAVWS